MDAGLHISFASS